MLIVRGTRLISKCAFTDMPPTQKEQHLNISPKPTFGSKSIQNFTGGFSAQQTRRTRCLSKGTSLLSSVGQIISSYKDPGSKFLTWICPTFQEKEQKLLNSKIRTLKHSKQGFSSINVLLNPINIPIKLMIQQYSVKQHQTSMVTVSAMLCQCQAH